jgi:hypothetical protein
MDLGAIEENRKVTLKTEKRRKKQIQVESKQKARELWHWCVRYWQKEDLISTAEAKHFMHELYVFESLLLYYLFLHLCSAVLLSLCGSMHSQS